MALDDSWMKDAACRGIEDPDVFFPESHQGVKLDHTQAKRICKRCPAKVSCLFFSIAHDIPEGVWGGLSKRQRNAISPELRSKIIKSWFTSHPNSSPMGSMGFFTKVPRRRIEDDWEGGD